MARKPTHHPDGPATRHEHYMRRCLELARVALAVGEVPVGAIVVDGDRILGEGSDCTRRRLDPSAHAEVRAIQDACRATGSTDLSGLSLYTTVEPCVLCAYVVRGTGIGHVVFGVAAGHLGGCTSRYRLLTDTAGSWPPPPRITRGILATECEAVMREGSQRRSGRQSDPGHRDGRREIVAVTMRRLGR